MKKLLVACILTTFTVSSFACGGAKNKTSDKQPEKQERDGQQG